MPKLPRLVATGDIVAMLGLGRQRVWQIMSDPTFPEPEQTVSSGRVWLREDVERWIAENR